MGILYVVATPIGNLEDITLRALKTLKSVDFIICEDTRHTKILIDRHNIEKPLISFHQHSRLQKVHEIIEKITDGQNAALVTDAGVPGISDPGGVLIEEAIQNKIKIEPIPGASALTALISIAGINTDKFIFVGFLPKKKGRQTLLENLKNIPFPFVFFESPMRIKRTLGDISEHLGDRKVIIGREITKKFEEIVRGRISEVTGNIKEQGEFTVMVYE